MIPALPADELEQRAAEQRFRLLNSVAELRSTVRERLDVRRNVNKNFMPATSLLSLVMLVFGYKMAGIFARH